MYEKGKRKKGKREKGRREKETKLCHLHRFFSLDWVNRIYYYYYSNVLVIGFGVSLAKIL